MKPIVLESVLPGVESFLTETATILERIDPEANTLEVVEQGYYGNRFCSSYKVSQRKHILVTVFPDLPEHHDSRASMIITGRTTRINRNAIDITHCKTPLELAEAVSRSRVE